MKLHEKIKYRHVNIAYNGPILMWLDLKWQCTKFLQYSCVRPWWHGASTIELMNKNLSHCNSHMLGEEEKGIMILGEWRGV